MPEDLTLGWSVTPDLVSKSGGLGKLRGPRHEPLAGENLRAMVEGCYGQPFSRNRIPIRFGRHSMTRSQPRPQSRRSPLRNVATGKYQRRNTRIVMTFSQVVQRIEALRPDCSMAEVAHLSVLAIHAANTEDALCDEHSLGELIQGMSLRLNQASDQHAAVTDELKALAQSDPKQFEREQIWTLIRAINVQDQLLQMYTGMAPLDA